MSDWVGELKEDLLSVTTRPRDAGDGPGELEELELGHTTVLFGASRGKYPDANSLLVRGSAETVLIDTSLSTVARYERLRDVDRVVHSHCHEDHIAGTALFKDRPVHFHADDVAGMHSLDHMMLIYGYPPEIERGFRKTVVDRFNYVPRSDAQSFGDGHVFDLGGVEVRAIHTPGHTRGHCALHMVPDDVLYLGDIDLSGFGPYYGDAWSDLEAFESSLVTVREIEARWYATSHHVGVVERDVFLERLERYEAVIASRESRLLEFLAEPRSLAEIATHRFVYRPGDNVPFASGVERRSMSQHVDRLVRTGLVRALDGERWEAIR